MKFAKLLLACSLIAAPIAQAADLAALVDAANAQLAADGSEIRIGMAEWITDAESGEVGQVQLFKNVGNKQLAFDFVPGDPRRGGRSNITYRTDGTEPSSDAVDTFGAIDSAMMTWDNESCSDIPITDLGDTGVDVGFVQAFFGFGGNPNINEPVNSMTDISHAGMLPAAFFFAFSGSNNVLGVSFTLIFGTDIDNNGLGDTAYREIYYNDGFNWVNNPDDAPGDGLIDLESVALHEAGHGLSQGHFGNASIILSNGKIRISPDAVMNAGYIFARQDLQGSDVGGHCSIWGNWPVN